jgi:hypothetical protein
MQHTQRRLPSCAMWAQHSSNRNTVRVRSAAGASRCPLGFYAEKGSRRACRQCPPGRTTQDDAERQQFVTHCDVERGHGVVAASAPADGDIFAADLTGMTEMAILSMSVLQCPTGYWGGGDTLGAKCQRCPEGSSTKEPGSTSLADCDGKCYRSSESLTW